MISENILHIYLYISRVPPGTRGITLLSYIYIYICIYIYILGISRQHRHNFINNNEITWHGVELDTLSCSQIARRCRNTVQDTHPRHIRQRILNSHQAVYFLTTRDPEITPGDILSYDIGSCNDIRQYTTYIFIYI
jgi:hypothetical protein